MPGPSRRCLPASLSPRPSPTRIPSACPRYSRLFLLFRSPLPSKTALHPQTTWLRQWRARIVFVVYRFLRLPSTRRRVGPPTLFSSTSALLSFSPPFPSSSSLSCRSSYRCRPPLFPLFTALSCPPPGRLVARGSHYSWKWKLRWSLLVIVPPAWMAATRCFQRFFDVDASPSPFSFLSLPPPSASYAVIFPR